MDSQFLPAHLRKGFSAKQLHFVKLSLAFLVLLLTSIYLISHTKSYDYQHVYHVAVSGKKGAFVKAYLGHDLDGPFDNSTISALCKKKRWTPGLIFRCEPPQGGIVNVRNAILNCVRLSIEAGATTLILPTILARRTPHSPLPDPKPVPFTHFFSLDHFATTLTSACPQINLLPSKDDLWDKPSTAKPVILDPASLTPHAKTSTLLNEIEVGNWTRNFKDWLNSTYTRDFDEDMPVMVDVKASMFTWPIGADPVEFIENFGQLLKFREDISRISAAVLFALSKKHDLKLDPRLGIENKKFYGAHLRTGGDVKAAGWTPYNVQESNYLYQAKSEGFEVVYAASDNLVDLYAFAEKARNLNLVVETKEVLLGGQMVYVEKMKGEKGEVKDGHDMGLMGDVSAATFEKRAVDVDGDGEGEIGEGGGVVKQGKKTVGETGFEREWDEFQELKWDQKNLVDYEVLSWAGRFGGLWESTLTWGVALRRHAILERDGGKMNKVTDSSAASAERSEAGGEKKREWIVEVPRGRREEKKGKATVNKPKVGEECFSDGLSAVFGPVDEGDVFFEGLWP